MREGKLSSMDVYVCREGVLEERSWGDCDAKDVHFERQLMARSCYVRLVGVGWQKSKDVKDWTLKLCVALCDMGSPSQSYWASYGITQCYLLPDTSEHAPGKSEYVPGRMEGWVHLGGWGYTLRWFTLGLHRIWLFQIRPKPNLAEFRNSNSAEAEAEFGWNLFSGHRTIRQW